MTARSLVTSPGGAILTALGVAAVGYVMFAYVKLRGEYGTLFSKKEKQS
jgi:hypothetical protein